MNSQISGNPRKERERENGEEEEESSEGLLLLLREGVRGREDSRSAPEGQALQVPCLQQEAVHRFRHGHPRPPGSQGSRLQVILLFPQLFLFHSTLFIILFLEQFCRNFFINPCHLQLPDSYFWLITILPFFF